MRVHIVHILEAAVGGTRRHLNDLVFGLDDKRFRQTVIVSPMRETSFQLDMERMQRAGVSVHVVPMRRAIAPLHDCVAFWRLAALLYRVRPDVVHCHSAKAGFLGRLVGEFLRTTVPRSRSAKLIYTPHAFPFLMRVGFAKRCFYLALERFVARFTDAIVCVSLSEQRAALDARLCSVDKLVVIENGIEIPNDKSMMTVREARVKIRRNWSMPDDSLIVGCVADFREQKGHRVLVDAAQRVIADVPNVRFMLVGDGELRRPLERLCEKRGVREQFVFAGRHEDARSFYAAFDLLVQPSFWEGGPYAPLEAAAKGLVVVATRVIGNRDVVRHGETGLLVPPDDEMALADAIIALLHDDILRRSMGEQGRMWVRERFSLRFQLGETEALYEQLLHGER